MLCEIYIPTLLKVVLQDVKMLLLRDRERKYTSADKVVFETWKAGLGWNVKEISMLNLSGNCGGGFLSAAEVLKEIVAGIRVFVDANLGQEKNI